MTKVHETTILLVEDSRAVRKSIAAFLNNYGYIVIEAENGEEGIKIFKSREPDVVITDIMMPGISGHEVVKTVVQEAPDTPIIVVSGTGDISDVVKAIQLGTWDYILKPITDLRVLLYSIQRALEKRNLVLQNRRYQHNLETEIAIRTAELQDSLREKEQLLKEVHHRVKNNLQIITSLLNLQIGIETCEECTTPMEKMKNRINSMALVHEQLYNTEDLSSIPFDHYIDELTAELKESYYLFNDQASAVTIESEIDDATFPIEIAVPLGLIVNELVTNSLRYAFDEAKSGKIYITLHHRNGEFHLSVSDNGKGLPEGVCPEGSGKTLGFVLISTLTEQLGGKLSISSKDGTKVYIVFPQKKW